MGLRSPEKAAYDALVDGMEGMTDLLASRPYGLLFDDGPWVVLPNGLKLGFNGIAGDPVDILLRQGEYESAETRFVVDNLKDGDTFIDVGANLGWFSLHVALARPGVRVHAFEPGTQPLEHLRSNLRKNDLADRVTVHPVALGNTPGEIHLTTNHYASNYVSAHRRDNTEAVSLRRLDDAVREHGIRDIGLIKIDVEGFELAVLEGARETLTAQTPTLLVEIVDDPEMHFEDREDPGVEPVASLLRSLGYAYGAFSEDGRFVEEGMLAKTALKRSYHNYVFARHLRKLRWA